MKTELKFHEKIIKSGAANLQEGLETVGGKLHLTDQRLIFEAHKFNVQRGKIEIELANIQSLINCWTKFLGLIPLLNNSLAVITKDGREYRFVLFNRGGWRFEIEAQKNSI